MVNGYDRSRLADGASRSQTSDHHAVARSSGPPGLRHAVRRVLRRGPGRGPAGGPGGGPGKGLRRGLVMVPAIVMLAACSSPPRNAVPQNGAARGVSLRLGGTYLPTERQLTLTVNDEPAMRGTFPPYTPALNLNGDYRGTPLRAECRFSSVLSEQRSLVGVVASGVQSAMGRTGDVCKMMVDDKLVATLNF